MKYEGSGSGKYCSCPQCGRVFCSEKALNGHMRSHPERLRRGMPPPPPLPPSKLEVNLKDWPAQSKRHRASIKNPNSPPGDKEENYPKLRTENEPELSELDSDYGGGISKAEPQNLDTESADLNDALVQGAVEVLASWLDQKRRVSEGFEKKRKSSELEIETPPASPIGRRVLIQCEECDMTFDCGKKYGGHKSSAHVQKLKSNAKQAGSGSGSGPDEYPCPECGKVFGSEKSLHGHMRCHPERTWRGMERPDTNSEGLIIHAGEGTPKSQPEKKQKSSESDSDAGEGKFEVELHDFNSDTGSASQSEKRPKSSDSHAAKVRARAEFKIFNSRSTSTSPIGIDLDDERVPGALEVLVNATEKKMSLGAHKCHTCGKVFKTHQALGGHMSSHSKFKIIIVDADGLQSSNANTSRRRRSKINCTAAAAAPAVENTAAAPAVEKVPWFDLNEMPDMDEDVC